jgi:uncharacterized integral membrane protein
MNEDFTFDDEQTPEKQKTRPGVVKLIVAAILAVLFIGFILQNSQDVPVEFLWWTWNIPMSLLLIATSVIAVIIWELAGYFQQRRKARAAQQR